MRVILFPNAVWPETVHHSWKQRPASLTAASPARPPHRGFGRLSVGLNGDRRRTMRSPTPGIARQGRAGPLMVVMLVLVLGSSSCAPSTQTAPKVAPTPDRPPAVVAECGGHEFDTAWKPVLGTGLDAAQQGAGPTVVFANDSANSVCDWLFLANELVSAGFRPVVFRFSGTEAANEDQAVRDLVEVADHGGSPGRYAVVGASFGGRVAIEAAATHPPRLAAIVVVSGERRIDSYRDITVDARRVSTPALYVGAREDPLTEGEHQQAQLHNAMHGRPNEWVRVEGSGHGTELLDSGMANGETVADHLTAFVDRQLT